jgi:ABC-2 type transport system ATP-binding protein
MKVITVRTIIKVNKLTKQYGKFTVVNNLSIEVTAGEIFGFLGPNGAGKTTSIKMLCGLLKPTAGGGQVLGFDIIKNNKQIVRRIGYMSQKFGLYEDMTALENVEFSGRLYAMSNNVLKKRVAEIITELKIEHFKNTLASNLSIGLRQRLALGCAIIHKPNLVFLDEPTSGADPISRREFWDFLYRLANEGVTVLISSHHLDEAEHCNKVCFINHGEIVVTDTPRKLKEEVIPYFLYSLKVEQPYQAMQELESVNYVREVVMHGNNIHVFTEKMDKAEECICQYLHERGIAVLNSQRITPSLDDVFVYLSRH